MNPNPYAWYSLVVKVLWSAPCLHKPRYTPSHIEGHRWGPSQARSWHPGSKAPLPEPLVIFTYQVGWNSTTYPQAGIRFQLANELVSTSSLTCSLPWSHVKRHIGMLWHAVSVQLLKHLKIVHESGQLGRQNQKHGLLNVYQLPHVDVTIVPAVALWMLLLDTVVLKEFGKPGWIEGELGSSGWWFTILGPRISPWKGGSLWRLHAFAQNSKQHQP